MNFWVVGSLNIDLVVDVDRFPAPGETVHGTDFGTFFGGKGGNQCMALARLGAAPRMIGCVGNDQFGERYRAEFVAAGVDVTHIETSIKESTGTALIEVESSGNNRIVIVAGANGMLEPAMALSALSHSPALASGDIILLQLETPIETVESVARLAQGRGAVVILDPSPAVPLSDDIYSAVSWLTPNEHEAALLTGIDTSSDMGLQRACIALGETGVEHVVIKAGARGAWYLSTSDSANDPSPRLVPGFVVDVMDTTAAGDSFNAGLAWALSRGDNGTHAIRTAAAVAAISVTVKGAQSAMPTAKQVANLLRQ